MDANADRLTGFHQVFQDPYIFDFDPNHVARFEKHLAGTANAEGRAGGQNVTRQKRNPGTEKFDQVPDGEHHERGIAVLHEGFVQVGGQFEPVGITGHLGAGDGRTQGRRAVQALGRQPTDDVVPA